MSNLNTSLKAELTANAEVIRRLTAKNRLIESLLSFDVGVQNVLEPTIRVPEVQVPEVLVPQTASSSAITRGMNPREREILITMVKMGEKNLFVNLNLLTNEIQKAHPGAKKGSTNAYVGRCMNALVLMGYVAHVSLGMYRVTDAGKAAAALPATPTDRRSSLPISGILLQEMQKNPDCVHYVKNLTRFVRNLPGNGGKTNQDYSQQVNSGTKTLRNQGSLTSPRRGEYVLTIRGKKAV